MELDIESLKAWNIELSDSYHGHYGTNWQTEHCYYLLSRGDAIPPVFATCRN